MASTTHKIDDWLKDGWYSATRRLGGWWTKPWTVWEHRPGDPLGGYTTSPVQHFRLRWSVWRCLRTCRRADEVVAMLREYV